MPDCPKLNSCCGGDFDYTSEQFTNRQQSFTATCETGAGDPVTVTIEPGQYFSTVSQQDADDQALAAAEDLAQAQLVCVAVAFNAGKVSTSECGTNAYDTLPCIGYSFSKTLNFAPVCSTAAWSATFSSGPFYFRGVLRTYDLSESFPLVTFWDGTCPIACRHAPREHPNGPLTIGPFESPVQIVALTNLIADDVWEVNGAAFNECTGAFNVIPSGTVLATLAVGETMTLSVFENYGAWCLGLGLVGVQLIGLNDCGDTSPTGVTTYSSAEQTYEAECPDGSTGDPVSVTLSAGVVSSTTSQAAANAAALAIATAWTGAQLSCVDACVEPNNLGAYWKLDEASGNRADSSGNGNTLIPTAAVGNAAGVISNAASFAGAGYLSIPNNSSVIFNNTAWSVSAWVRLSSVAGLQQILGNNVVAYTGQGISLQSSGGSCSVLLCYAPGSYQTVGIGTLSINTWYHIAFTKSVHSGIGSTLTCYLNGAQVGQIVVHSMSGFFSQPFCIGNGLVGRVDETAIFRRVLTPSEILVLYNAGAADRPCDI